MVTTLAAIVCSQYLTGTFLQDLGDGSEYTLEFGQENRVLYRLGQSKLDGKFSVQNGTVTVQIRNLPKDSTLSSNFQIVHWDQTIFLLAEDEIPFFFYRLKHGWKGEHAAKKEVGFLRDDHGLASSLPGEPQLPPSWKTFAKRFTIINCGYDDHGPINGGTGQGALKGAVLKQVDGDALAWVEDVDSDQGYVYRLGSAKLRPGQRVEASESPVPWRKLIKQRRAELVGKG